MPASLSRRLFIQWLPNEPIEPTNTLVLTSPEGRFIDIRILKDSSLPARSSDESPHNYQLDAESIEWAFAGRNETKVVKREVFDAEQLNATITRAKDFSNNTTFVDDRRDARAVHSKWMHLIDSRYIDAEKAVDQAEMIIFPHMNLALEKSSMLNFATGLTTGYIEAWQDDELSDAESRAVVVLELDEADSHAKGMLIRIGKYMSGVARINDRFVLRTWVEKADWSEMSSFGDNIFPSNAAAENKIKTGESFLCTDESGRVWKWIVVEQSQH